MNGKERRLRRVFNQSTGRSLVLAVDHGMALGPMTGIVNIAETIRTLDDTG
jgi:putative autoinducer-2 (AI-2) aldolase